MNQTAAIKELRTAETLDPLNAATHRLLARILAQQNNLADAEHELKLALRLKPSADTHLELGVVDGQLGKLNEAVAQFRRRDSARSRACGRPPHAGHCLCAGRLTTMARWNNFEWLWRPESE